VVQLEGNFFGVAVWVQDQDGTPIYEIRHRGIRVLRLAALLAVQETKASAARSCPLPSAFSSFDTNRLRSPLYVAISTRGAVWETS
jgi:hypothetical protein